MSPIVEAGPTSGIERACGTWRGSNWLRRSRTRFVILYLMITIPAFASTDIPTKGVVSWIVLTCITAAVYEWRARRMGVEIRVEGVALIRPLNRTLVAWSEVERFFAPDLRRGDHTIHVQRKRFAGLRVPQRVGLQLPTIEIAGQNRAIWRWYGPCDLVCGAHRVPQHEVLDFLNGLVDHFDQPVAL